MNTQDANKDFKAFLKSYRKIKKSFVIGADNANYWNDLEGAKAQVKGLVYRAGFSESLSRANLLKLITVQRLERFMPEHTFYIKLTESIDSDNI